MRGIDQNQSGMFSYVSPEARVPNDHPLRVIRTMVDQALGRLHWKFSQLYSSTGRPSIPPEQLLRALVLQVLYSVPLDGLTSVGCSSDPRQPGSRRRCWIGRISLTT
jgi:hypothetical protein